MIMASNVLQMTTSVMIGFYFSHIFEDPSLILFDHELRDSGRLCLASYYHIEPSILLYHSPRLSPTLAASDERASPPGRRLWFRHHKHI